MEWYVGAGMVLGVLLMAVGAAELWTARAPRWLHRRVGRPRLHGLGALLTATPCAVQGYFYFHILPSPSWEIRFFGGNALLFGGLLLMGLGQMLRRPGDGVPARR